MAAPQLPAAGSLLPDAGNDVEVTQRLEDLLAVTRQLPGAAASTTLTLDGNTGGRAVATGARHTVDTFGAAAAGTMAKLGATNLDLGRRVKLSCASSLRPVTLLHAAGGTEQFLLANAVPMALASDTATIELERLSDGWHEVDRWWGTQDGSFRGWIGVKTQATYDLASQAEAEAGALDTRMMSALKVRQALLAKGWAAALPVYGGTFDPTRWLLYYDAGTPGLYRVPGSAVVGQAPNKFYDSGNIVVTASTDSGGGFVHGLGAKPRLVQPTLVCVADDAGYDAAAGDTVLPLAGLGVWFNGTNVGWATGPAVSVLNLNTHTTTSITFASWRARIVCWT